VIDSDLALPNFKITEDVPVVKIKSLRLNNFKAFDDYVFDFTENNECKPFACFYGPNGCGKTTVLDAIQLIFSKFDGREKDKIKNLLGKLVRHVDKNQNGIYGKEDFTVTADLVSSLGNYEVIINKNGFISGHPDQIKDLIYRLFYYARFDQELHQFQLEREKWNIFKDLFESVTGFETEEKKNIFDQSEDPVQAEILKKYVLGFWIHKPDETISHTECSAGERKIIKSFSTLLNKEITPSVVCIDNAEMHVESGRHIQLIEAMKRCFPTSQIFATTHSYQISKNFGKRTQLYDIRLVKSDPLIRKEPWRLYLSDEIKECLFKLGSIIVAQEIKDKEMKKGQELIYRCFNDTNSLDLPQKCVEFMHMVSDFFVSDICSYYSKEI